jgi:flagellar biosynthesis chaperone FliJ
MNNSEVSVSYESYEQQINAKIQTVFHKSKMDEYNAFVSSIIKSRSKI